MSILVLETKGQKMKKASFTNIVECLYFIVIKTERNQFNLKYYRKNKHFQVQRHYHKRCNKMKNKIKNKKEETNFPKRNDKKIKFEAFQYDTMNSYTFLLEQLD